MLIATAYRENVERGYRAMVRTGMVIRQPGPRVHDSVRRRRRRRTSTKWRAEENEYTDERGPIHT